MKKLLIYLLAAASAAAIIYFGRFKPEYNMAEIRVIQSGTRKDLLNLPVYMAMDMGIFARHGLNIQLIFAGNSRRPIDEVLSGHADFAIDNPIWAARAQEQGQHAKAVLLLNTNFGISGFTNNEKISEIKLPGQLNGLKISSKPKPSSMYMQIEQIIKDYRLNAQIIPRRFQTPRLKPGQIDLVLDTEPTVSEREELGSRVVFSLHNFTVPQAASGIIVHEDTIQNRPLLLQKAANSIQEALSIIKNSPDEAFITAQKNFPQLSDKVLKAAVNRLILYQTFPPSVVIRREYWQEAIRERLASGELKKFIPLEQAIDNRFAHKAFEEYGDDNEL